MGNIVISDLHKGMNLRDAAEDISPGETGESIGIDFSEPGIIKPMRSDLLVQEFDSGVPDVQWAEKVYIQNVEYQFTTHSDGMRVTIAGVVTLLDAAFTGTFKCLVINDQYVVFSNATLVKKWMPGWAATIQWGLNTPPAPTLALAALTTKVIDGFDSLTNWTRAGGGTAGAMALDNTYYNSSTGSIKMTASAKTSVTITKPVTLDLSKFTTVGDLGLGWIDAWFLASDLTAVTALHVSFDCSTGANFKTDWYQSDITINNVASASLSYGAGGTVDVPTSGGNTIPVTTSGQYATLVYDASLNQIDVVGIPGKKTKKQTIVKYQSFGISDAPLDFQQVIVLTKKKRQTVATSAVWMHFRFQLSEFTRNGADPNRDWSTITAIQIKFDCGATAGSVNVDSLNLLGGGYPFGSYWFAQSYENDFGNYGPFSEFAGPIDAEGQQIIISGLTPDSDTQTTKRRIAVIGGSMTDPMVFFITNNTATSYTYNLEDTAFTTIETNFHNDPPLPCTDMILAGDRVFMVKDNQLLYSNIEFYEGFPESNYLIFPNEVLKQVAELGNQYVAVRGLKEVLIQLLSSDPTTWAIVAGAREGAASSNLLINVGNGQHVWASNSFFWSGTDAEYLPKVGFAVSDFTQVFGAQASDLVYLWFMDTSGTPCVLRIDYRLGDPIAHYVENITPTCIFADQATRQIFYSLGNKIYQFDSGGDAMPVKLVIPEQFAQSSKIKDFSAINYDLAGGPFDMQIVRRRKTLTGVYSLPDSDLDGDAVTLPPGSTISQGFILATAGGSSLVVDEDGLYAVDENGAIASDEGFVLTLPIKIDYVEVGG